VRLFVAITPPDEAVEHLDAFLEVRREAGPEMRWSPPELWHLTLAFCADFPERRLEELGERLARAAARRHPVEARLTAGGAFPGVAHARVLWVGLDADRTEVGRMATGARAAVSKAGGHVDGQRFRPHLTLARLGHPEDVVGWVRLLDAYEGPQWRLDTLGLVASHLGEGPRRRPRHELIGSWPLSG
jgi:2'-5' RNA ligase